MKSVKLAVSRHDPRTSFRIKRLGSHEVMQPGMVDRPNGTRDFLFMLFHTEVTVKVSDGERVCAPSSLVIWPPPDGHYYGNMEGTWDHSWFHCSGREIMPILKASRVPLRQGIALSDPSLMDHFLLEVIAELSGWSRPHGHILKNLFENFILALTRQTRQRNEQLVPTCLLEARAYIEQHFTEHIRLGDLARRAGWSEPHLCTEFRRYFGIPVIQYALQLRMNQAAYLLRDYNRRIGEIALLVGYPDLYSFSKMFKRHVGISPRRFREGNLSGELPVMGSHGRREKGR